MRTDRFEWDDGKAAGNFKRHKVPFDLAARVFDGDCLEKQDLREDYGEARYITYG